MDGERVEHRADPRVTQSIALCTRTTQHMSTYAPCTPCMGLSGQGCSTPAQTHAAAVAGLQADAGEDRACKGRRTLSVTATPMSRLRSSSSRAMLRPMMPAPTTTTSTCSSAALQARSRLDRRLR